MAFDRDLGTVKRQRGSTLAREKLFITSNYRIYIYKFRSRNAYEI